MAEINLALKIPVTGQQFGQDDIGRRQDKAVVKETCAPAVRTATLCSEVETKSEITVINC
ncbi:hypothetical protein COOONC_24708 [Cooperia oncophora]